MENGSRTIWRACRREWQENKGLSAPQDPHQEKSTQVSLIAESNAHPAGSTAVLSARSQTFPRPLQLPAEHRRQPTPKKKTTSKPTVSGGRSRWLTAVWGRKANQQWAAQAKQGLEETMKMSMLCQKYLVTQRHPKKPTQLVILLLRKGDGRQRQTTKQLT